MAGPRIRARPPGTPVERPAVLEDAADVAPYLHDSSRAPGGRAARVYRPRTEGEVAWVLRHEERVLPVGAQSSLTGGGAPRGDAVLAFDRMDAVVDVGPDGVRAQPGVSLVALEAALDARGLAYPPTPTFTGASVGGVVSTNAAGAATWKYGSTRDWVQALTVVLASGDVLDVRRGEVRAGPEGFEVEATDGALLRVPVPGYRMPDVPKRSAGYHAEPGVDLVDLLVGSEGTLGVVTEASLRVVADPPAVLVALVPLSSEAAALDLVGTLRRVSRETWRSGDPRGLDVRAVESMDRRCLELLREDREDRKHGVDLPSDADTALIVQLEVPAGADLEADLAAFAAGEGPDTAGGRFLALLQERGALDETEVALPGDRPRREQLFAVREAVPVAVNHRVERAQREVDPRIHKVAGDMIVPFAHFAHVMAFYRRAFVERGLDLAIWGHASDGNVHPNALPASADEVRRGYEALRACGREVLRLGGCPLSEHGTGRNPLKQELLRLLYGEEGIAAMQATKRALDPTWKLAPGVIFPRPDEGLRSAGSAP